MKQKKFVERRAKPAVFYNQSLTRSRTCYGAKQFDNGYVAYAEFGHIDVFDKDFTLVEKGVEDVYFFASGESFIKNLGSTEWQLRDNKRHCVAVGDDVKVLSSRLAAIKDVNGKWSVYMFGNDIGVQHIYSFDGEGVLHVICHDLENDHCLLVLNYGKNYTLFAFDYQSRIEPKERKVEDYTFTHNGLLIVSEHGTLLGVNKTDKCSLVCASGGGSMRVYDKNFNQIYKHVTDIITFKNGVYFVCKDGLWSFYTKNDRYFGELFSLEICRCGAINGKESPVQEKALNVGRYDENYIVVIQGNQTVITDGNTVVSAINMHYNDVAILK